MQPSQPAPTPRAPLPLVAQRQRQQLSLIRGLRRLFALLHDNEQFENCYEQFQSEFEMERQRRRDNNNSEDDASERKQPAKIDGNKKDSSSQKRLRAATENDTNDTKRRKKNNNTVSRVTLPSAASRAAVAACSTDTPPTAVAVTTPAQQGDNDTAPPLTTQKSQRVLLKSKHPSFQKQWDIRFSNLEMYKQKHGHVFVSIHDEDDFPSLYNWVKRQQKELNKASRGEQSRLSLECIHRLEQIGLVIPPLHESISSISFIPQPHQQQQQQQPLELGNDNDSNSSTTSNSNQSKYQRPLGINERLWNENYRSLQDFKIKFGNVNHSTAIAKTDKSYASLNTWVMAQKVQWRRAIQLGQQASRLDEEHIRLLQEIGLGSDQGPLDIRRDEYNAAFHTKFQQLVAYHKEHGHFNVLKYNPNKNHKYYTLGKWMTRQKQNFQRREYKKATGETKPEDSKGSIMTDEQYEMLSSINFPFPPPPASFKTRLAQICEYNARKRYVVVDDAATAAPAAPANTTTSLGQYEDPHQDQQEEEEDASSKID